ncbi:hypothetical protein PTSG_12288 [Salpingoeca rosetta]|uniref:Endoglycoceramidase n=1 Tax=Salpingoeca rosetta (strain ATCC 50818 / BSB-021) TaxID=946362 RepID=F2U9Z7_SALR5|nr:uncharacterized protein PTSG_12288 [Salpingoeca rosetta]EGD73572.1 hypothetical protein PTSG_12288 [Salpingoeca rosetta]|eukprot:XP_004993854.1 hypothetical protein PTSG_12288 [Salpingoeca rosetta]
MRGGGVGVVAAAAVLVVAVGICVVDPQHVAAQPLVVNTTTSRLVDSHGRERIFHGTNVVFKGPPYVPIIDRFDYQYSFSKDDVALLSKWGVNAIRLGVMWPGVEPEKGKYNQTYLQHLQNITAMCEEQGIWVLLDMHQDVWSERFCGEGVPYWAADPGPDAKGFPAPLDKPYNVNSTTGLPSAQDCGKHDWPDYYFASAVGAAVQRMYDNQDGLLDAFCSFWALVASTFKSYTNILGYELINEPWAGDVNKDPDLLVPGQADKKNLQNTYDKAAAAIRAVDPDTPIFFETVTWDDVVVGFSHPPGGADSGHKSVLAYHYYMPPNFGPKETIQLHLDAAKKLNCGTFCSETDGEVFFETADPFFQSWMRWEYKAFVPKTGSNFGFWNSNGTVNSDMVFNLTRTYAPIIAGHGVDMHFSRENSTFELAFLLNKTCTAPTVVYAYTALHYPNGVNITVDPPVLSWAETTTNYYEFKPILRVAKDGQRVTVTFKNGESHANAVHSDGLGG